jgi:hypothetical protein
MRMIGSRRFIPPALPENQIHSHKDLGGITANATMHAALGRTPRPR